MKFPFTIEKENSIIYISLNTEESSVNILTQKATKQLNDFFYKLEKESAALIVFRSKKPYSFINGAELLLKTSIKDFKDVAQLTRQTRSVYDNVFNSPIPTLAVIQGNCYGCGLEFVLCCDYRIASSSYDTHFFLTEIKDYFVLPFFGAIEKLPYIIGLKAAIDLIVFGKTWCSNEAAINGLIDQVLQVETFEQEAANFIQKILKSKQKKQSTRFIKQNHSGKPMLRLSKTIEAQIRKRILDMPPSQHIIHLKCLDLLIKSASNDLGTISVEENEMNCFDTGATKESYNASSFFFIRSMARASSLGTTERIPDQSIKVVIINSKNTPFFNMLSNRRIANLELIEENNSDIQHNVSYSTLYHIIGSINNERIPIEVNWEYSKIINASFYHVLYFPAPQVCDICEVHLSSKMIPTLRTFLILLDHIGWQPVVTYVKNESPVNIFLHTYLEFAKKVLNDTTSINMLNYSLWYFGFELFPADIAKIVHNKYLYSKSFTNCKYNKSLVMDLLYDLFNQAIMILDNKWLKHTSQIDVLMRSLFGFPLEKGSFYSFMTKHKNK